MYPVIDNLASCKIRTVIRFLHAKNVSELYAAVYCQNVMSEGEDYGAEYSKMEEQMFAMKSEVVGHL
jgi:hypothetical protein